MSDKILQALGFRKIIKIPDKTDFDQLTWEEFGLMIDAFFEGDTEAFAAIALSEFLDWKVNSPSVQDLQREIKDNLLLPADGKEIPPVNEQYLRALSVRLKSVGYP